MAAGDIQFQLVTFQLGEELYGVNIMDVKEIVKIQNVRPIPHAPHYVEGIFNLRGEIIPVINLHKRFRLQRPTEELHEGEGGLIILNLDGIKISIIIDKISRVVMINSSDVKPPPQMLTGIGSEYIDGVVQQDNHYLIVLNIRKLFDPKELQKLLSTQN